MKTPTRKSLIAIALVGGSLGALLGLRALWEGTRKTQGGIVQQSTLFQSPDSRWQATLEHIDNGLGFGLGALYDEVHLHGPEASVGRHGASGSSVVFNIKSQGGAHPRVQWLSPNHLLIEYRNPHKPGKCITPFQGITIEYRPLPAPGR